MRRPNRLLTVFTIVPLIAGCYSPPKLPEGQAAFLTVDLATADIPPFNGFLQVVSIDGLRIISNPYPKPIILAPGRHKVQLEWSNIPRNPNFPTMFEAKGEVEFVAEAGKTYIAKVMEAEVTAFGRPKAGVKFWIEPEVP